MDEEPRIYYVQWASIAPVMGLSWHDRLFNHVLHSAAFVNEEECKRYALMHAIEVGCHLHDDWNLDEDPSFAARFTWHGHDLIYRPVEGDTAKAYKAAVLRSPVVIEGRY